MRLVFGKLLGRNETFPLIQLLLKWVKCLFHSNLLAWVRIYIKEGSVPLIDFVNWLVSD